MVSLVALIAFIGSLICFIIVVIKLFQEKGVLHGILGIICSLYTFIWGWMESGRLKIQNVMIIWSACLVVGIGVRAALLHH
ncbi:MAG TPA: hypothetical protein VGM54_14365 [Chthoniobacter sp.]|jgi:hypothetical protein